MARLNQSESQYKYLLATEMAQKARDLFGNLNIQGIPRSRDFPGEGPGRRRAIYLYSYNSFKHGLTGNYF